MTSLTLSLPVDTPLSPIPRFDANVSTPSRGRSHTTTTTSSNPLHPASAQQPHRRRGSIFDFPTHMGSPQHTRKVSAIALNGPLSPTPKKNSISVPTQNRNNESASHALAPINTVLTNSARLNRANSVDMSSNAAAMVGFISPLKKRRNMSVSLQYTQALKQLETMTPATSTPLSSSSSSSNSLNMSPTSHTPSSAGSFFSQQHSRSASSSISSDRFIPSRSHVHNAITLQQFNAHKEREYHKELAIPKEEDDKSKRKNNDENDTIRYTSLLAETLGVGSINPSISDSPTSSMTRTLSSSSSSSAILTMSGSSVLSFREHSIYSSRRILATPFESLEMDENISLESRLKSPLHHKEEGGLKSYSSKKKKTLEEREKDRELSLMNKLPDKVLDAPGLLDDYYLNLLHWSQTGLLAIALGSRVYVWNSVTSETTVLVDAEETGEPITSVRWNEDGTALAVGYQAKNIHIYDVETQSIQRELNGFHHSRVSALDWSSNKLASGGRDALVNIFDIRHRSPLLRTHQKHEEEICGLAFHADGNILATGGNDNLLNIYDISANTINYTFTAHTAAVKALAFCPFSPNILASGGGTADGYIRFWNIYTGQEINSIHVGTQICSLQWAPHGENEIISAHGGSLNSIHVWSYPTLKKMATLTGHEKRILHTTISQDGTTLCSASADETLRFWKLWDAVETTRSNKEETTRSSILEFQQLR